MLEKDVCSDQCILFEKLSYPLPCFTLYSKAKLACYSRYLLSSYFCIPSPMMKRTSFLVLVLEGLWAFIEPFDLSFFSVSGWDIVLYYCDIEWIALEMNWDQSVLFEMAHKYYISDSY